MNMSSGVPKLSSGFNVSGSSAANQISNSVDKDKDSLWYFSSEQLANSPSRRHGIDVDQELSYRQMTAYLIQEMGQRLQVSQLCINTAIVYMHRFYAFHSFTHFHRNGIAAASLFLAAKVEEQPRKLEHVIKAANKCLNQSTSSTTDAYYLEQAQDLVFNENVLLQTLGFDVAIDHPHTHVVKTCHLVKACKDLAQTSYFLASNSLHLTSMCLQYKPTVVACFCIYLACKWSRWEIPQSNEGKHFFHYVDKSVTMDLLKQLTDEFIAIYEKSPARLKSKLNSIKALAQGAGSRIINKDKKAKAEEWKMVDMMKMYHSSINTNDPINICTTSNSLSSSSTSEQQAQSAGQSALLPPPPSHLHQQQIRRTDSHSSQHRAHHSASTSHHHLKQTFTINDVPDQKATTSHKQQHNNTSASRQQRDHSQFAQNMNVISIIPTSATNSARSSCAPVINNNGNNNNNNNRPAVSTASQKLSSQQHEPSFQKSRDRNSVVNTSAASGAALLQTHKLPQKTDVNRMVPKEHIERISEQNKTASNKIYSSTNVATTANHQMSGSDMSTRNILQHPRLPPPGYHQSMSRTSSGKHDQSMSNVQRPAQPHKHLLSLESQLNPGCSDSLQQSLHVAAVHSNARSTDINQNNEDANTDSAQTFSSMRPFPGFKSQPQHQTKMPLINPEVNEAMHLHQHMGIGSVLNNKKTERDRSLDSLAKKERSRISYPGVADVVTNQSMAAPRNNSLSTQKLLTQKKLDTGNPSNVLAGTSASSAYSGMKRSNDGAPVSQEMDLMRDSKIRKLDNTSAINAIGQSYSEGRSATDSNKLQIVNGIETNPDLVRTLLKESLCTTNALIKTEPLPTVTIHPPSQLLQPPNVLVKEEKFSASSVQGSMDTDESAFGKTEKKKKKEKHKHKEKDKSKDREERKRHKKEKDRHKIREVETGENKKFMISNEKREAVTTAGDSGGLKVIINKKLISGDLNIGANARPSASADNCNDTNVSSTPAIRIKLAKEEHENCITDAEPAAAFNNSNNPIIINNTQTGYALANSNSGSGKKKDRERDREREKEKKRLLSEHVNKVPTNGGGSSIGGISYTQSSSYSKNINSNSKIQQYNNNMSQLFGESNDDDDDDDDDDDRTYQRPRKAGLNKSASSASAAAQNYYTAPKQSTDFGFSNEGSINVLQQQQQQQQQFHPHQLTSTHQQQRQFYHKK